MLAQRGAGVGATPEIACARQADSWELRAASLARPRRDRAEAHVYGCFAEDFDTPNIKGAMALLD